MGPKALRTGKDALSFYKAVNNPLGFRPATARISNEHLGIIRSEALDKILTEITSNPSRLFLYRVTPK